MFAQERQLVFRVELLRRGNTGPLVPGLMGMNMCAGSCQVDIIARHTTGGLGIGGAARKWQAWAPRVFVDF